VTDYPEDLASVAARLQVAGSVFAEEEAELLLSSGGDAVTLASMVARRVAGEPVEAIVGWASFCGLRITVAPGVFVPRRRTELLVTEALRIVRDETHRNPQSDGALRHGLSPVVVDICCGSGAVGAAVAAEVPEAEVYAADLDPVCVACARRNLPPDRVFEGDLYDALPTDLRGRVDLLVANAPYVPTSKIPLMPPEARDHEPTVALDGGPDGLDVQRRIIDGAPEWLAPGGQLLVETSRHQAAGTVAACEAAGLVPRVVTDDDLDATAVVGRRP
jgi:release factor glutamine methyltransferase